MAKRHHAGNTWTRKWGPGRLARGGEQNAEGAGEGQENERCGCPMGAKRIGHSGMEGGLRQRGRDVGGLQGAWEATERGISPPSPVLQWRWGRKSPWDPWPRNCSPASAQWLTCVGHTLPEAPGDPPNCPRVQGSVLGEVLAASPNHQWLGVRTDVPWDRHQYIRSRILAFSFPRSRWVLG